MPVPRYRREVKKVDYVVVRRTGLDGEEETEAFDTIPKPTATSNHLLDRSNIPRQPQPTNSRDDSDSDSDDDDSDKYHPPPLVPVLMTITLPQAQATGGALAAQGPTETVVVTYAPPPRPEGGGRRGGISQTTEHLLIAAGSIGTL